MADVTPAVQVGSVERLGTVWMAAGLAAFGLATGTTTGLSTQEGISQTLLTSLFSFASGALLSYAGFSRLARQTTGTVVSNRKVGAGLLAFSLGVLVGVVGGAYVRSGSEKGSLFGVSVKAPITLHRPPPSEADTCRTVQDRVKERNYAADESGRKSMESDLAWFADRYVCGK